MRFRFCVPVVLVLFASFSLGTGASVSLDHLARAGKLVDALGMVAVSKAILNGLKSKYPDRFQSFTASKENEVLQSQKEFTQKQLAQTMTPSDLSQALLFYATPEGQKLALIVGKAAFLEDPVAMFAKSNIIK